MATKHCVQTTTYPSLKTYHLRMLLIAGMLLIVGCCRASPHDTTAARSLTNRKFKSSIYSKPSTWGRKNDYQDDDGSMSNAATGMEGLNTAIAEYGTTLDKIDSFLDDIATVTSVGTMFREFMAAHHKIVMAASKFTSCLDVSLSAKWSSLTDDDTNNLTVITCDVQFMKDYRNGKRPKKIIYYAGPTLNRRKNAHYKNDVNSCPTCNEHIMLRSHPNNETFSDIWKAEFQQWLNHVHEMYSIKGQNLDVIPMTFYQLIEGMVRKHAFELFTHKYILKNDMSAVHKEEMLDSMHFYRGEKVETKTGNDPGVNIIESVYAPLEQTEATNAVTYGLPAGILIMEHL